MNDLAALVAERCEVLYLEPAVGRHGQAVLAARRRELRGRISRCPPNCPILAETLRAIGVERLHFHHVHLLPRAILDLPSAVGVPYDCTLHDYYPICPQYHLVTEDGSYCGEPDATGCAACLTRRPGQWGLDITAWRGAFGQLLRGADRDHRAVARCRGADAPLFPRNRDQRLAAPRGRRRRRCRGSRASRCWATFRRKRACMSSPPARVMHAIADCPWCSACWARRPSRCRSRPTCR